MKLVIHLNESFSILLCFSSIAISYRLTNSGSGFWKIGPLIDQSVCSICLVYSSRFDLCDFMLPSAEVGLANGVKPKKKKKVQSKKGKQVEEKGQQNDTETDKIIQKGNQKTSDHV